MLQKLENSLFVGGIDLSNFLAKFWVVCSRGEPARSQDVPIGLFPLSPLFVLLFISSSICETLYSINRSTISLLCTVYCLEGFVFDCAGTC